MMQGLVTLPIVLQSLLAIAGSLFSGVELAIEVNDTVTLACTLSVPEGEAPFSAVIVIPGGGPHTRDCDVFGFRLCRDTAHHLLSHGIASLRCDKRGIGQSTGNPSLLETTTADLAEDVLGQVAYLETRPEIDPLRIGLHGMSEGATVAAMVDARSDDVEFVILVSLATLPARQVAQDQAAARMRRKGMDEDEIAARIELWDRLYDAIERGEPRWGAAIGELRQELIRKYLDDAERAPAEWLERVGDLERHVERLVNGEFNTATSRWGRFLLAYDVKEDLARMDSRVLALYGSKDLQVHAEPNAGLLEATFHEAGKPNYEIRILENANHIFQQAVTGGVAEYSELPGEFISGYLEAITEWVLGEPSSRSASPN